MRVVIEAFLAVGQKWGRESGATTKDIHAMTRKGKGRGGKGEGKDHRASRGKGKNNKGGKDKNKEHEKGKGPWQGEL